MKNEKIKLLINDIGTNGEGVANKDGVTYFVPFCLPKEEVEATVTFKKGNVAQAKLEKIVKSVPVHICAEMLKYRTTAKSGIL